MRLKLKLDVNNLVLPLNYYSGIQAFIYSCLSPDTARSFHDSDIFEDNHAVKPFVFSRLIGEYSTQRNRIIFNDTCVLYIASPMENFLLEIYNFLVHQKNISLYGNYCPIIEIEGFENRSKDGTVRYRTLSPITVYETLEDKTTRYFTPEEEDFRYKLLDNIGHKYLMVYGKEKEEFCNIYNFTNIKRQICKYKDFYYEAYRCEFTVDAPKIIHDLIMDMGLGSRNAIGFGMVEKKK